VDIEVGGDVAMTDGGAERIGTVLALLVSSAIEEGERCGNSSRRPPRPWGQLA
jgi:hypothetical protein